MLYNTQYIILNQKKKENDNKKSKLKNNDKNHKYINFVQYNQPCTYLFFNCWDGKILRDKYIYFFKIKVIKKTTTNNT